MGEAKRRTDFLNLVETEGDSVVDFKLMNGGNIPPDGNWLSSIEVGDMFLVQKKQGQEFVLGCFKMVEKTEKSCILLMQGSPDPIFVNPVRFCVTYSLHEIINVNLPEEEGTEDEDSNRTDSVEPGRTAPTLATDEGVPVEP